MQFKEIRTVDAVGWQLVHSVRVGDRRLAKGLMLTADHIQEIGAAGIESVHAFRLETTDIREDKAASLIAEHVRGPNLSLGHAARGRCNLHADKSGLLVIDSEISDLNSASEAITLATLPDFSPVAKGQLVATAKIIPYAVDEADLDAACKRPALLRIAPYQPFSVCLIATGQSAPEKSRCLTEARLASLLGKISIHTSCLHTVDDLRDTLLAHTKAESDLILVMGLSAISDRRDIVPAALEAAGGEIVSLGMPVDPGNLLMLGRLEEKTVIGLPGCARSAALNGLDWVLERFATRLPLDRTVIANMGVGGLLKETPHRPEPRAPLHRDTGPTVQPLILAAGRSSRAGGANKLLSQMKGQAVVRNTVSSWRDTKALPPVIVTGHQASDIEKSLSGLVHDIVFNPGYASGMASSLKLGISHVDQQAEFACVCLGDMPFVTADTYRALAETANRLSEFKIFIPTFNGKRGHPVLWHRDMFAELGLIDGDRGGRSLIHSHEALVCEVPVDDPGILIDLDTPEALAQFGIEPYSSEA